MKRYNCCLFRSRSNILILFSQIQAVDRFEAPEIDIDANFKTNYIIRAGNSLRILVTYTGTPKPSAFWLKSGLDLEPHAVAQDTGAFTLLIIESTKRTDSGKYTLTLENCAGEKKITFTVKILGTYK